MKKLIDSLQLWDELYGGAPSTWAVYILLAVNLALVANLIFGGAS